VSGDCIACRALALPGTLAAGIIFGIASERERATRLCEAHRDMASVAANSIRAQREAETFVREMFPEGP
jgi:hypothetical protein